MFLCPKCSYSAKTKGYFDEHFERVHEGVVIARCPICEKTFNNKSNVGQHIKESHGTEHFPCSECDYIGKTKRHLTVHTGINHKDKIFACEFCDFRAGYQHQINGHTRRSHYNELSDVSWLKQSTKKCHFDGCEYENIRLYKVTEHIKVKHEEGIKYACNKCEYQATTPVNLSSHIQCIHEGVKYPCNQCDYQGSKAALRQHLKIKHF